MNPDMYGRLVSQISGDPGEDCYQVDDETGNGFAGTIFTLCVPTGTVLSQVYSTINAMAPSWYAAPNE